MPNQCTSTTPGAAIAPASYCSQSEPPRRRGRTLVKKWLTPWTALAIITLWVLASDQAHFIDYTYNTSRAFLGTLPIILLAVTLIAYLKSANATALIAAAFAGRENTLIFAAALLGGLAPFCSCEVIPLIAGLLAVGMPLPAVMAFWLSSPLIDPPALLITAGILGWPFAIAKAVIAIGMGLTGGFVLKLFSEVPAFKSPLKHGVHNKLDAGKTNWCFWRAPLGRQRFTTEYRQNLLFLTKWLLLAYALEAIMVLYMPADLIANAVGGKGLLSVVVAALIGMPAYLSGYAAPALVGGFMAQGMDTGAAMAFMTAGAISSIPAMTAVWSLVNKTVFFTYVTLGVTGAIIFSYGFGLLF